VRRGAIVVFIEFTLTANMTAGSATATIDQWWGTDEPASPTVVNDRQGLFTRALEGAKGIAVLDTEDNLFIVLECQSKAGAVRSTLAANMTAGSANSVVNDFWGSQQDVQSPGSSVILYDDATLFPLALDGAKALSIFDAIDDRYRVYQCQQMVQRVSGTIPSELNDGCGLLFADASFDIDVADLEGVTFSPFNQMPGGESITIHNVHGWSAAIGSYFKAEYHATKERWELYQITARCEDPENCPPEE
jgi:hypothetical protein